MGIQLLRGGGENRVEVSHSSGKHLQGWPSRKAQPNGSHKLRTWSRSASGSLVGYPTTHPQPCLSMVWWLSCNLSIQGFGAALLGHIMLCSAPAVMSLAMGYQCTSRAEDKPPCQRAATKLPRATGLPHVICHAALGARVPACPQIFLVTEVWIVSHQLAVQAGRREVTLVLTSQMASPKTYLSCWLDRI